MQGESPMGDVLGGTWSGSAQGSLYWGTAGDGFHCLAVEALECNMKLHSSASFFYGSLRLGFSESASWINSTQRSTNERDVRYVVVARRIVKV